MTRKTLNPVKLWKKTVKVHGLYHFTIGTKGYGTTINQMNCYGLIIKHYFAVRTAMIALNIVKIYMNIFLGGCVVKRNYKQELELFLLSKYSAIGVAGWMLETEFKFHPHRKWRFDYALPARKIAIEYEGQAYQGGKSRHNTIKGFENDCEKYSTASIMGWKVVRVTANMIKNGKAFELLEMI